MVLKTQRRSKTRGVARTPVAKAPFVRLVLAWLHLALASLLVVIPAGFCLAEGVPEGCGGTEEIGAEVTEEVMASVARPLPLHPLVRIRPNVVDERFVWEIVVKDHAAMRVRARYGGLGLRERAEIIAWRLSAVMYSGVTNPFLPGKKNGETIVLCNDELIATVDRRSAMLNDSTPEGLAWVWCDNLNRLLGRINTTRSGRMPKVSRGDFEGKWRIVRSIQGVASWYGPGFHGKETASGEKYNQWDLTAAHATLPFGTRVLVTNLETQKSVIVRVNDRGPWIKGRIIDLSRRAAQEIGLLDTGIGGVRLDVLE